MTTPSTTTMRERWLIGREDGGLWLLNREGEQVSGGPVSLDELRAASPGLHHRLATERNLPSPKVLIERVALDPIERAQMAARFPELVAAQRDRKL